MIRMTIMAIGNMIIVGILLAMIMLSGCAVKPKVIVNEDFKKQFDNIERRFKSYEGQNISIVRKKEPRIEGSGRYLTYRKKKIYERSVTRVGLDNREIYLDIVVYIQVNEQNIISKTECTSERNDLKIQTYY